MLALAARSALRARSRPIASGLRKAATSSTRGEPPAVATATASATASAAEPGSEFRRHLLRLAWPERWRLAGGFVLLAGGSSVSIAFPKVMGTVMDACLAGGESGWTPATAAGALCGLFGVQAVVIAARGRVLSAAGERVAARLRRETFASLLRHDAAFFDRSKVGELISRLASDTSSLQKLVVADAVGAARGVIMVGGCTLGMLHLSPWLFLVSSASFPLAVLVARAMGERMRARQREVQDSLALAAAEAQRALSSVKTLMLFNAEGDALRRYGGRVDAARDHAVRVGADGALTEAGVGLALQASLLSVLAVGGQQVIDGSLSYGDLSAFLMYSVFTGFNCGSLASAYAELRRASGASERVLRLLEPELGPRGAATLGDFRGRVELRGVGFAYPTRPERPVLRDLSLTIGAGERVAIVGPSGCGKSTIAALLSGLYAPTAGRVLLDGADVGSLDGRHLRGELVSVVPQEPVLLGGTLRENIALGRPGASEAELRAAAAAAGCEFAEADWTREVGEHGLQLSGGQKQRVAIARVLLRNTPVLVLDEFSSALDAGTEGEVLASLSDEALADRTLILITHRRTALQIVDRVVELGRDGRVERSRGAEGEQVQLT